VNIPDQKLDQFNSPGSGVYGLALFTIKSKSCWRVTAPQPSPPRHDELLAASSTNDYAKSAWGSGGERHGAGKVSKTRRGVRRLGLGFRE